MTVHVFVEFQIPEARAFADLTGIRYDLESARSLATKLQRVMEGDNPDYELVDALTTAILVRYSRPFSGGIRKWPKEDVLDELSAEQRHKHDRLRNFRDKHIAHSVNAFEKNQPIARYVEGREYSEGVYSVECQHGRIVGLNSSETESVIDLATAMIEYVDRLLDVEKEALLAKVRSISFDHLLLKKGIRTPLSPSADIKRAR
ncbi:MAG: hypothetical protein OXN90_02850 [Gemmatimonadota bacterium]|nr:hypothetical protein [Gemmatimonadota bacterium]